jgi:hypothetical protein
LRNPYISLVFSGMDRFIPISMLRRSLLDHLCAASIFV